MEEYLSLKPELKENKGFMQKFLTKKYDILAEDYKNPEKRAFLLEEMTKWALDLKSIYPCLTA